MANLNIIVSPKVTEPPTVDVGPDIELILPDNSTTINALANDDEGIVSYQWTQISGASVTLIGANTSTLTLNNLNIGVYEFQVTVSDIDGLTASDSIIVTVIPDNQPPTSDAGADQTIDISIYDGQLDPNYDPINTTGSAYTLKVPVSVANTISSIFSSDSNNGIDIRVRKITGLDTAFYSVIVNSIDVSTGLITITTTDINPTTAERVNGIGVQSGLELTYQRIHGTLNGANSNDIDGNINSYQWTQLSGPTILTTATPNNAITNIRNLQVGTYVASLEVIDDDGASDIDSITIQVVDNIAQNIPKIISIGPLRDSIDDFIGNIDGNNIDTIGHSTPWSIPVSISSIDNISTDVNLIVRIANNGNQVFNDSVTVNSGTGQAIFTIPQSQLLIGGVNDPIEYIVEVSASNTNNQSISLQRTMLLLDSSLGGSQARIVVESNESTQCYSERVVTVNIPSGETRTTGIITVVDNIDNVIPPGYVSITPNVGTINTNTTYTIRIEGQSANDTRTNVTLTVKDNGQVEASTALVRDHNSNLC